MPSCIVRRSPGEKRRKRLDVCAADKGVGRRELSGATEVGVRRFEGEYSNAGGEGEAIGKGEHCSGAALMPAGRSKRWQLNLFSFFVTGISRFLMLRDRLRGVPRRLKRAAGGDEFFFASGGRSLAAVLVAAGARS